MNNLLKAAALALVLALGSIQPSSPLYPVKMTVENTIAGEATETKLQMEFAQEQTDEMRRLADYGQDDSCPGGKCDPVRDDNHDVGCSGDDCDDKGFAQRVHTVIPDHESDCPGGNCGPIEDHDRGGTCPDGNCGGNQDGGGQEDSCPGGNCGGDQGGDGHEDGCPGGHCGSGDQGGSGHDGGGHGGGGHGGKH